MCWEHCSAARWGQGPSSGLEGRKHGMSCCCTTKPSSKGSDLTHWPHRDFRPMGAALTVPFPAPVNVRGCCLRMKPEPAKALRGLSPWLGSTFWPLWPHCSQFAASCQLWAPPGSPLIQAWDLLFIYRISIATNGKSIEWPRDACRHAWPDFRAVLCGARSWTQWSLQVSSDSGNSVILWFYDCMFIKCALDSCHNLFSMLKVLLRLGFWMEPTFRHQQIVKGERIGYADLLHLLDG